MGLREYRSNGGLYFRGKRRSFQMVRGGERALGGRDADPES